MICSRAAGARMRRGRRGRHPEHGLGSGRTRHGGRQRRTVRRGQRRRDGLHAEASPNRSRRRCASTAWRRAGSKPPGANRPRTIGNSAPRTSRCCGAGERPKTSPKPPRFWSRPPPALSPDRSWRSTAGYDWHGRGALMCSWIRCTHSVHDLHSLHLLLSADDCHVRRGAFAAAQSQSNTDA